ncbi:MAG TPA: dCTP deaminase [archaeon]|nr:dCTP deaminase [archaeon]
MAVLTKSEILKLLKNGKLKIKPFDEKDVGPGSIDLHLGNTFRVFKKSHEIFHVNDDVDHKDITNVVEVDDKSYFMVMPSEMVHGITKEHISLPSNISGRIEGRSRFARIGLLTHVSSGFIQPGTSSKVVLEMVNLSPMPLAIYPETKICQIILEETKGSEKYHGKFSEQERI